MALTREADYAVRIILDLADHGGGAPVRSADIARRQLIPRDFLTKVIQRLARSGHVRTYRGRRGGIALAHDPEALTLLGVVEAIEGPVRVNRCVAGGECPLERRCAVHPVWKRIQELVIWELENTSIGTLRRTIAADPVQHKPAQYKEDGNA